MLVNNPSKEITPKSSEISWIKAKQKTEQNRALSGIGDKKAVSSKNACGMIQKLFNPAKLDKLGSPKNLDSSNHDLGSIPKLVP